MTDEPTPDQTTLSPDGRYRWDGHAWVPADAAAPGATTPYGAPTPYTSPQHDQDPYVPNPYGPNPYGQAPHSPGNPYAANPYGAGPYSPGVPTGPVPPYLGQQPGPPKDAPHLGAGWLVALSPVLTLGFLVLLGWYVGQFPGDADLPEREATILGATMIGGWLAGSVLALVGGLVDRERLSRAGVQVSLVWAILALVVWPVGSLGHLISRRARSGKGTGGIVTWAVLVAGLFSSFVVLVAVTALETSGIDGPGLEKYLERDIPENVTEGLEVDEDAVSVDCPGDEEYALDATVTCQVDLGYGFEGRAEVTFPTRGVYRWLLFEDEGTTTDS